VTTTTPRTVRAAVFVLAALVVVAAVGPWIAPRGATESGALTAERLVPPSATHPLGTDAASRDVLARMVVGTSVSIGIAGIALAVVVIVGAACGGVAALGPRWLDRWIMRVVDAVLALPRVLVVLGLVTFTGRLGPPGLGLLLGLTGWAPMARLVRGRLRELDDADFVVAARAVGATPAAVFWRHLLPATGPAILAAATVTVATTVPLEAALTYLNVGLAPPNPSWGAILQEAADRPLDAWWLLLFPSAAIAATVMSVQVIGERLQPGAQRPHAT
jgi:ABC-type dipeptide/oligopeptide/nickel transport system permease subunit